MGRENDGFCDDDKDNFYGDLIEREMTREETIEYLKKNITDYEKEVAYCKGECLKTMAEIKEYEHMRKQLNGETPLQTYYTGKRRKYFQDAAEAVIQFSNINKINLLSDDELFEKVALKSLSWIEDDVQIDDAYINQHITVRDRMYIDEGIKKAKEFLDFEWVEAVIEKYSWAQITGEELFEFVKDAQKKLIEHKTKYLEELVAAGERILFTKYSSYFHHTVNCPLSKYVADAKEFRKKNWDFDLVCET